MSVIYPSMVIRSQAEAIELLQQENHQLKERLRQLDNGFTACVEEKCELADENERLKNDNAVMKANLIRIHDEQLEQCKSELQKIIEIIDKVEPIYKHYIWYKSIQQIIKRVKDIV